MFNCCTDFCNCVFFAFLVLTIFLDRIKSSYLVEMSHSSPQCRWTNVNCKDLIVLKNIIVD